MSTLDDAIADYCIRRVMKQSTRVFLELVVGNTHSVEVLIHFRRSDAEWFHSSPEHKEELISLLGNKVLPIQFAKDIEAYHEKRKPRDPNAPVEVVGEKNAPKKAIAKRKRGKKDQLQDLPTEKTKRDVTHAFSDHIKIAYRLQEITQYESATLMVQPSGETKELKVRQLVKLPKRLVLWCYPRSEGSDPTDPDPDDSGFPRQELIPIGSIFRQQVIDVDGSK
jgi:hypothetical protein